MATKLKVNYEFVGDSTTPVTRTNSIKHGDSMLNTVVDTQSDRIDKLSNYVTPQMYGAKGDGVTDDTLAIQMALNSGKDVYIPEGSYRTTSTLLAETECNINCVGKIIVDADVDGIVIGKSTPRIDDSGWFIGKNVILFIIKKNINWNNDNSAIVLSNVWRIDLSFKSGNFTNGLVLLGNDYGCAWNKIYPTSMFDCKNGIVLKPIGEGWVNQNTFVGGSIAWAHNTVITNTTTASPVFGVKILKTSVDGGCNENAFYNLSIDGVGNNAESRNYYVGIDCNGTWNHFDYCRLERLGSCKFEGEWNVLFYPYLFDYTAITKVTSDAMFLYHEGGNFVASYGDTVFKLQSLHNKNIIEGYNNELNKTSFLSSDGVLTLSSDLRTDGTIIGFYGMKLLNSRFAVVAGGTPDEIDNNASISQMYIGVNTGAGVGMIIGVKYSENDSSQFQVGLYGMTFRTKTNGVWGEWKGVTLNE